jgi:hypothetical protein
MRRRPTTPTDAVVQAVAAVRGVDPTELTEPLYDVVDPEALDALLASSNGEMTVSFRYGGHVVRVTDDLSVFVDGSAADDT